MHKKILANGSKFRFDNIYIYILPLENKLKKESTSSQSYLSINITKKAFPKAVARHNVKRKFIEYFRLNRSWINKYHIFVRVVANKKLKSFDIMQFDKDFKSIEVLNAKN